MGMNRQPSRQETVARAIYESRNGRGCVPWGRLTKAHQEPYLSDATAALTALLALDHPWLIGAAPTPSPDPQRIG